MRVASAILNGGLRFSTAHRVSGTGTLFAERRFFPSWIEWAAKNEPVPDCRRIALGHVA